MRFLFPGFKTKTLTFSYDDGTAQDRRLIALFRKYGVKGTFNINSGFLGGKGPITHGGFTVPFDKVEPEELSTLYRGFEIASHNSRHCSMTKPDADRIEQELTEDVETLERLSGQKVRGFAYPCGSFDHHSAGVLRAHGIAYARTIADTHDFSLPQQFHYWHPTCHDRDPRLPELCRRFAGEAPEELWLLYMWGHSFELDKDDIDRWENLEAHLRVVAGRDDVWYATNIEICDYVNAVRACVWDGEVLRNPGELTVYALHGGRTFAVAPGTEKTLTQAG